MAVCKSPSDAGTGRMAEVLALCTDLTERIGIYCDESAASVTHLSRLCEILKDERGSTPARGDQSN